MFEFLADQNFLSALAATIGPLAFFAAPTEEIELLLLNDIGNSGDSVVTAHTVPEYVRIEPPLAEAA